MRQVFISYSSQDADRANEIVKALEDRDVQCWIAPRNIETGSDYATDIPKGIKECPCFLLVFSQNSQKSPFVKKELSRAIKQNKRILPLMIGDFPISEEFDFLLEDVQIRPYAHAADNTLQEILGIIEKSKESPAVCFQKGLKSYKEKDYDQAILWLEQAYHGGENRAAGYLGVCWYQKKHFDNAVKWYDIADGHGDVHALSNKALCYCYLDEAHRDWKKAEEIFLTAARKKHPGAKYNLGILHECGRLGAVDLLKARDYYEQAVRLGEPNSAAALERVNKKIADGA